MKRRRWSEGPKTATVRTNLFVPIVGDGAQLGRPVLQGRLVPVLLLDCRERPEVAEAIRIHGEPPTSPGDALSRWGSDRDNADRVFLHLRLRRPVEVEFYVPFSIERQAILVESVLTAEAVYIQDGIHGDLPSRKMNDPKVLVEIPNAGFRQHWDDLLLTRLTAVLCRDTGLSRRSARVQASALIERMREAAASRLPPLDAGQSSDSHGA